MAQDAFSSPEAPQQRELLFLFLLVLFVKEKDLHSLEL